DLRDGLVSCSRVCPSRRIDRRSARSSPKSKSAGCSAPQYPPRLHVVPILDTSGRRRNNPRTLPKDRFNREIDYLRISLVDHCNLRCVYCMPLDARRSAPETKWLEPAELEMVARAAIGVGFRKIRLTGGEPTLRPDLLEIVERLASIEGVDDL